MLITGLTISVLTAASPEIKAPTATERFLLEKLHKKDPLEKLR
jgi:hypothetical protein